MVGDPFDGGGEHAEGSTTVRRLSRDHVSRHKRPHGGENVGGGEVEGDFVDDTECGAGRRILVNIFGDRFSSNGEETLEDRTSEVIVLDLGTLATKR